MAGGKLSTGGTRAGQMIDVRIVVEGADKTSRELKDARREFNARIRGVMQKVGERRVLPIIRPKIPATFGGKDTALFVQRERSGVFIGSRLHGNLNRALGWWDFGGKRPLDSERRTGPLVIVRTLDRQRPHIDNEILDELDKAFNPLDFDKSP